MIEINNLTIKITETSILKDVSLSISENKIVGLIAPNGTGKTTFLKSIAGLVSKKGKVLLNSCDLIENRSMYLKQIFFVESSENIYSNLTAMDHLEYIKSTWGSDVNITEVLASLGMEKYKAIPIKKLSLGMKQHVLIAMYVVSDAPVLLLDEPMNGLDPTSLTIVNNLLVELKEQGKTIIFSSHNLSNINEICDEFLFMHNEKLVLVKANTHNIQEIYDEFYIKGAQ